MAQCQKLPNNISHLRTWVHKNLALGLFQSFLASQKHFLFQNVDFKGASHIVQC